MQTINDIVELIFSNPPKQPMSFEISFDFSNGSNLFHFLMTILINGAKKLYGPDIIPSQISKDMFNVLQEYFNSFGYTIKYEYKYADDNILLSGYIKGDKELEDKTVMAWLRKGKGQFVIFGFNPQFRASTGATYKLLFNSLLLPKISE